MTGICRFFQNNEFINHMLQSFDLSWIIFLHALGQLFQQAVDKLFVFGLRKHELEQTFYYHHDLLEKRILRDTVSSIIHKLYSQQ